MSYTNSINSTPIPEKRNLAIFFIVLPTTWWLLWVASHSTFLYMFLAAWAYSLLHNTIFSLLHEAAHGVLSNNRLRNDFFGIVSAATFPTSFTMQKIAHLGHHERNRTDKELYDYYLPSESKTVRNIWMYGGNLFGLYWFMIPLSN
jgi:fatty acid desaturase